MAASLDALVLPFGMVLARVGTFVATCPVFVSDNVSKSIRGAVGGVLAVTLFGTLEHISPPVDLIPGLLTEVMLGGLLAASVRLTAVAIGFAGEMFDINLGYSFARTINPMLGEEATPIMMLSQMLGGMLFYIANGQAHVVRGLALSFKVFPPGTGGFNLDWPELFASHLSLVVQAGLLLALPITLTMMCTQLALALLSRIAPSLNVWAIGLLGTCGMGLLALWNFLPPWLEAMLHMWHQEVPFGQVLQSLRRAVP